MAAKPRPVADAQEAVALMHSAPARGRGRKSPVLVWLTENRATISAGLTKTGPAWGVLATYLGERNVLDGDGRPPTARNVREAWARVQAAAQASPREPPNEQPATVRSIEPSALPPSDDMLAADPDGRFQPASLRNHTPAAPRAPLPPRPSAAKRDASAEIARLLGNQPQRDFPSSKSED